MNPLGTLRSNCQRECISATMLYVQDPPDIRQDGLSQIAMAHRESIQRSLTIQVLVLLLVLLVIAKSHCPLCDVHVIGSMVLSFTSQHLAHRVGIRPLLPCAMALSFRQHSGSSDTSDIWLLALSVFLHSPPSAALHGCH